MPENGGGMGKIAKLGVILFIITAVTGLILGVVNDITAGPIRATQERVKQTALAGALPEASEFTVVELAGDAGIVKEVSKGTNGGSLEGYCVTVTPKGYAGEIEIVVGVKASGGVRAIRILSQSETPGLGAKAPQPSFSDQFNNKDVEKFDVVKRGASSDSEISAISGATITSTAVTLGVNTALDYWKNNLKGGE